MRRWRYTLDVSDIWRSDLSDEEKRPLLAERVARFAKRIDSDYLGEIADDLRDATTTEEFNAAWSELYDYADFFKVWVDTLGARGVTQ